ncbi:MAG TPA: chromosome segregation protein SMC [Ignavibacteriaceae bacterium]|nr:chromosome segregation protein SMC [Ignavibacteriaceae bacterium]
MYLSRLEILGFKSFAYKTVVNFNQGVTSIVGPNGCGKTNIVDAIRWCLGEQKSNTLRSDKMENVIFNGTSNKKPMGMAEVSLTIVNNRGILPTEYSEVTITRRIFRSGESEYLLNKNLCRLKDIVNLFMDTGIGANAYSVIELKMVETILSSKADERRKLFEEAAGVNKYKLRRRLSLNKLDEVKTDLTRVNDIVSEVEKKVSSLERQAKRADKHNKISTSLRELEVDLAEREYALYNIKNEEIKTTKEENFKQRIVVESDLSKFEDNLKEIKINLNEVEQQLKEKRSDITRNKEKIFETQKTISISEERKKSLEKNLIRFEQELNEYKEQLEETYLFIDESKGIIADIESKLGKKETDRKTTEEQLNSFKSQYEIKKEELKVFSNSLLDRFKEISQKENSYNNLKKALEDKNKLIAKLNDRISSLTNNIAKTVGFIEDLNDEKIEIEKKFQESEALYAAKQKEKEELEKKLNKLKEKELEDKSYINSIKDKISFIQNLIDNLEGVSKGAKVLLENSSWANGSRSLLAHIGDSSEEHRLAVEAALKNNLNNILIETLEDLKNGIQYLKDTESGKASFYINNLYDPKKQSFLTKIQSYFNKRKTKKLLTEPGIIGWAKDFVITDEKWKPYFNNILDNIIVVDNLDTAFKLSEKYHVFNFVTLDGDYIDRCGVVEAGSAPKLDDSLFGRKLLLENLKNEFPVREESLANLKIIIYETEEQLNAIDLKVLSDQGKYLLNDLGNVEKQIAQFEFEKQKAVDEIERARKELQEHAAESNRLDSQKNDLEIEVRSKKEEKDKADKEQENLENDVKKFEEEFNQIAASLNKLNLELERLAGEKRNTLNEVARSQEMIENIKKSIDKRDNDIKSANEEADTITGLLDEYLETYKEYESTGAILQKEEGEIDNVYKTIRQEISAIENNLSSLRKRKEQISDEIHSADIKQSEIKNKISNLIEHIKENYSLTLLLKTFDDLGEFDFVTKRQEVDSLKQQIKNLGPINLLAYSEFEEEKQRMEFLQKQRNDLVESEKDIIKTIDEINNTAKTLFSETFEKIRGHFVNIFRGLFNPGDEADLRLEENADPLEAKIEIIAKPKGKRPTSIELLSGGEKTLTAIALLFAIYLVKPSPFCILDEIDAPLDDANIDRFTKIISDFSKDTQFIVVTHNKRTMEAASTLYGVTMQEEGVSKLVSVRFNEDLTFVA